MYAAALELQTRLSEAWLELSAAGKVADLGDGEPRVVTDVRDAHPPCLLIPPPRRVNDLSCGRTLVWGIVSLVPGPGTADSWRALDDLLLVAEHALDVEESVPGSYTIPGAPEAVPCYVSTTREAR